MSDTVSLILAAVASALGALVAGDPAWLSDPAQAIIGALIVFLSAVAIKRPGRTATPTREDVQDRIPGNMEWP